MGVGFNTNGNYWVQLFANSKSIFSVTSSSTKQEYLESEIIDVYLTITTANGYLSYMPVDFAPMKQVGGRYYPMLDVKTLPEFVKLEVEQKPETFKPEETTPVIPDPDVDTTPKPDSGNLFSRYKPN